MAEFDDWAAIYDIVHSGLPGELNYYLALPHQAEGRVLELGCGTGRIAVKLAEAGIRTVGLDLSRPMLDACASKWVSISGEGNLPSETLVLIQADMSAFDLDQKFPLIIMPYRSFMHLLRFKEQLACLECIANHLEDGGRFIMNIWKPTAGYIHAFSSAPDEPEYSHIDTYQNSGVPGKIDHYHSVFCDEFEQSLVEEHVFITVDDEGEEQGRKALPLLRTWLTVREMHNLIAASSLEVESVFGDFSETPIYSGSTESIWVLKRQGSK
jgi:SAM-dependent methyltransferase